MVCLARHFVDGSFSDIAAVMLAIQNCLSVVVNDLSVNMVSGRSRC